MEKKKKKKEKKIKHAAFVLAPLRMVPKEKHDTAPLRWLASWGMFMLAKLYQGMTLPLHSPAGPHLCHSSPSHAWVHMLPVCTASSHYIKHPFSHISTERYSANWINMVQFKNVNPDRACVFTAGWVDCSYITASNHINATHCLQSKNFSGQRSFAWCLLLDLINIIWVDKWMFFLLWVLSVQAHANTKLRQQVCSIVFHLIQQNRVRTWDFSRV